MKTSHAPNPTLLAQGARTFGGQPAVRGMTLVELTVVILVLLSMVTMLFFGAQGWKKGSDRAICIMQIQNVQKGVRSYSNLSGFQPGDTVPDLFGHVIGAGRYVQATPLCPGSGVYTFGQAHGINTIPPLGKLYMECSFADSDLHQLDTSPNW